MIKVAASAVSYTLATHAVEKLNPSRDAITLCTKIAEGQISGDMAVKEVLKKYNVKFAEQHE